MMLLSSPEKGREEKNQNRQLRPTFCPNGANDKWIIFRHRYFAPMGR